MRVSDANLVDVRLSHEFDSNASGFASCGRIGSADDPPLAPLVHKAVSELEVHRQNADVRGLGHFMVWGRA